MARLSLNKSTLSEQIKQLKTYRNFLPSLDLKRRQLQSEQERRAKSCESWMIAWKRFSRWLRSRFRCWATHMSMCAESFA
jgi:hypothetical protein